VSDRSQRLRQLPSVDDVLKELSALASSYPRSLIVNETRRVLEQHREEVRSGRDAEPESVAQRVAAALRHLESPSLQAVINATGVVLHTNLGRAPLARFSPVEGYSNLEYDLNSGRRGKRDVHIATVLERLLGAPAIAVNNNAAAVFLALSEFAKGFEVIVSRGELIEIGDGFRIPDIMSASGALLREVGTTNRTTVDDYRNAINERTRLLLRVHPSNFRIEGFTAKPSLEELAALSRSSQIPLYEDLGSGCVVDLRAYGVEEPLAAASRAAGVDLVSFSGDKLLGGPQCGILAGRAELIARLRRNPMYRALRLDQLIMQSLETTLRLTLLERWEEIPAIAMIRLSSAEIRARAEGVLSAAAPFEAALIEGASVIGGGSTPGQSLPTWLIAISGAKALEYERRLRSSRPPLIGRIEEGNLLLDLRTVLPSQDVLVSEILRGL
jgi:L-seryl-tRNA(Ser) seleniumtransferase